MRDSLIQFLQKLKDNSNLLSLGEIATKAGIIEPILRTLGWDTSITSGEVVLEYPIEQFRLDYCLQTNKYTLLFLEAKKPSENLEDHVDQLLGYAFREGVKLAVLSSGVKWAFYLPLAEGKWENRRFYTVNVLEQDSSEAASRLIDFLSRENVANGEAVRNAEKLLGGKRRQEIIESTIPEAWNQIISDASPPLKHLLSELTNKLCGFPPSIDDIDRFFESNADRLLLPPTDEPPQEIEIARPIQLAKSRGYVTRERIPIKESDKIPVGNLVPEIVKILQIYGGRARKEQGGIGNL